MMSGEEIQVQVPAQAPSHFTETPRCWGCNTLLEFGAPSRHSLALPIHWNALEDF